KPGSMKTRTYASGRGVCCLRQAAHIKFEGSISEVERHGLRVGHCDGTEGHGGEEIARRCLVLLLHAKQLTVACEEHLRQRGGKRGRENEKVISLVKKQRFY